MIIISTVSSSKPLPTMQRVYEDVKKKMDEGLFGQMERESQKIFLEELVFLAKKMKTTVIAHNKPWIFKADSGEKISMPAGYFIWKGKVLHQVFNDNCNDLEKSFGGKRKVRVAIS